jgi:hypothetical protein
MPQTVSSAHRDSSSSKPLASVPRPALLDSTLMLLLTAAWLAHTTVSAVPRARHASPATRLMATEFLTVPLLGAFLIPVTLKTSLRCVLLAPPGVRSAHPKLTAPSVPRDPLCIMTTSATLRAVLTASS